MRLIDNAKRKINEIHVYKINDPTQRPTKSFTGNRWDECSYVLSCANLHTRVRERECLLYTSEQSKLLTHLP